MKGYVLPLLVLVLAGCLHRGALPAGQPGGSFADGLATGLVWLALACLLGAGMAAAFAICVRSTVAGFASIMWAICFGCLGTLVGAVALGTLAPAIPWILGGLAVLGGAVLGLHYWRRVVAWVQGDDRPPVPLPPVSTPAA